MVCRVLWVWVFLIPFELLAGGPLDQNQFVPSAPPHLMQELVSPMEGCPRYFLYRGKKWNCDSHLGRDAQHLRVILQEVPGACEELDLYRDHLNKIENLSYLGTLGLAALLVGFFVGRASTTGNVLFTGGLGMIAAVGVYGFFFMTTNESHRISAVQKYNQARPEDRIELQLGTKIHF